MFFLVVYASKDNQESQAGLNKLKVYFIEFQMHNNMIIRFTDFLSSNLLLTTHRLCHFSAKHVPPVAPKMEPTTPPQQEQVNVGVAMCFD